MLGTITYNLSTSEVTYNRYLFIYKCKKYDRVIYLFYSITQTKYSITYMYIELQQTRGSLESIYSLKYLAINYISCINDYLIFFS